jgi:hypothetical protein
MLAMELSLFEGWYEKKNYNLLSGSDRYIGLLIT